MSSSIATYTVVPTRVMGPTGSNYIPSGDISPVERLFIDVLDSLDLALIVIAVRFPDAPNPYTEVAYAGGAFTPEYAQQSTQTSITGGTRFFVMRGATWPSRPRLVVYASDSKGLVL